MKKNQVPYLRDDTVSGEIIRILTKKSKYGNIYYDCLFKMTSTGSCFRSCIYSQCKNFVNWSNLLKVGNILVNLSLISRHGRIFVDADSFPVLIRKANPEIEIVKPIYRKNQILQHELF